MELRPASSTALQVAVLVWISLHPLPHEILNHLGSAPGSIRSHWSVMLQAPVLLCHCSASSCSGRVGGIDGLRQFLVKAPTAYRCSDRSIKRQPQNTISINNTPRPFKCRLWKAHHGIQTSQMDLIRDESSRLVFLCKIGEEVFLPCIFLVALMTGI